VVLEHLLVLVVAIREGFPDGGGPAVAGAGDPDSSGSSFVIFSFIFAISVRISAKKSEAAFASGYALLSIVLQQRGFPVHGAGRQ
jgi:hypothetical protein